MSMIMSTSKTMLLKLSQIAESEQDWGRGGNQAIKTK